MDTPFVILPSNELQVYEINGDLKEYGNRSAVHKPVRACISIAPGNAGGMGQFFSPSNELQVYEINGDLKEYGNRLYTSPLGLAYQ